jgi:hypothetical protein
LARKKGKALVMPYALRFRAGATFFVDHPYPATFKLSATWPDPLYFLPPDLYSKKMEGNK